MSNAMRDSRVCVPQLPLRHVPRPRLLAELDYAADRPLTLLSAGPGAGKTVLLTDWVRRGGTRVAWLTPTAADAEPRRFWRLLESALRDGDGVEIGSVAATPRAVGVDLVQALFSRAPEPEARLVVVIDDAHVLSHPDVLAGLDSLIRGWQPRLRLILAARSDPLLPLHRYRLAGQMHELRAADLAMTPAEIAEVLLGIPPALELAAALRSLVSGDLGGRIRSVQRILPPDVVGSDPGLAVAVALGQASVLMTRGEVNEARAMLQEAGPRIPPLLAVMRDVMLAGLDTSLGRPHAALKLLRNYQGGELAILTAIPSARAHLALSDLRSAQDCVRTVLTTPSTQTSRFLLVEAMLCDAEIAQRSDDPGRALEILIRALEIARGEIVLPFLNMKDVFGALLTRHPLVAGQWPVPQPGIPADPVAGPPAVNPRDLPEPLTQRELTILRFLATSMSTSEIADELCLSVNTVKTHLAAIYRKLPAGRRREAVVRARELELI